MNERHNLSDNLVLAVLCTLLLSGVNLASLYTLLHQHQDQDGQPDLPDGHACSFTRALFMGVTESKGWS